MKTLRITSLFRLLATLLIIHYTFLIGAALRAQMTPVPTEFSDWTGAADSNFFNAANWSTGVVPNSPTAAIRLPGDTSIANTTIYMTHNDVGDMRYQFYSMQTGASGLYTVVLEGNENGWLEWNPVGKGFTFNGIIGTTPESGAGNDMTNPTSTGNGSTRNSMNIVLNSYSRIVCDDSYASMRVLNNGMAQAVVTLNGNAEIDISRAGSNPFVWSSGTFRGNSVFAIGGIRMSEGTVFNLGTFTTELRLNGKGQVGETYEMAGLIQYDPSATSAKLYFYGNAVTLMSGTLNSYGEVRTMGSQTQYVVDGLHNSASLLINSAGSSLGGSGTINAAVTVANKATITAGMLGTASSKPLTINGTLKLLGSLSLDLVTETSYDEMIINGDLLIGDSTYDAALSIGRASTFPLLPGTYTLVTVNGNIIGEFNEEHVSLPTSMSLKPSWRWAGKQLQVSFEQLPFASSPLVTGRHRIIAEHLDTFVNGDVIPLALYDALNRQPNIKNFNKVLDQLSPSTFQSWFPSAIVRTNSMVQTLEDMMFQDAVLGRKKNTVQTFLQGYRQESSRAETDLAMYSNYDTQAIIGGFDYAIGEKFVAGAFVEYEKTEFDLDTAGGFSDVDSYTFGLKARYNTGKFQLNLVGFYGADDYSSSRTVADTQLATWADSDTSGTRYGAAASIAYTLVVPEWFEVTPTVGVQWMKWQADGFQETGGRQASLYVYDQSAKSLQMKYGARIARTFKINHGHIRPFFHYSILHEFETDTRTLSAKLFGGRYEIEAPGSRTNGWRLDFGFDWLVTEKVRIDMRYISEYRGAANESVGVRAGVTYTF